MRNEVCSKGTVKLWDVQTGRLVQTLESLGSRVDGAAFSPDGKTVILEQEGSLKLWDVSKWTAPQTSAN